MSTYDDFLEASAIVGEKELYEFTFSDSIEYYTSSWQTITIPDGHAWNSSGSDIDYVNAPIIRDSLKAKHGLSPDVTKLLLPVESPRFQQVLVNGQSGPVTLKIIRGFGDPVNYPEHFVRYWFSGTISELQIKDSIVAVTAKSIEYLLGLVKIPRHRIMRTCNYALFTPQTLGEASMYRGGCGLVESNYTYAFTVNQVATDGSWLRVTPDDAGNSEFDSPDSEGDPFSGVPPSLGHYTLGRVWPEGEASGHSSMIIKHDHTPGDAYCRLYLHIPLLGITATPPDNRIEASWGCDGTSPTCINKFGNRINGGMWHRTPSFEPAKVAVFDNT